MKQVMLATTLKPKDAHIKHLAGMAYIVVPGYILAGVKQET
jgi:hypothetical protein